MSLSTILKYCCIAVCFFTSAQLYANDSIYEARRLAYIDSSLLSSSDHKLCIQAYANGTVDLNLITDILQEIPTRSTADFQLVKLVRTLFLTNGLYDSLIYNTIDTFPYWLTKGDILRGYWSENHMIMWMSCDWLLHEKFGRPIDANLETRLKHYLRMKIKYGYYEFFSTVYAPYSLSGLLNLADFAQDAEIKSLATQAAVRLLRDLLMVTNDQGVIYAVAGRNYYGSYNSPYNKNHTSLIYLLTGKGERPRNPSHSGSFLATSTLQVDSIVSTWIPTLDTLYKIGHSLDSALILHGTQSPLDKMMFLWSGGGYFHPKVAYQSAELLTDSAIWMHVDFTPFRAFQSFTSAQILEIAEGLPAVSMSTVICGQDVAIFKSNQVVLSSVQDFWKGKQGYQQYPCVANVGTTAVYTASGRVSSNWNDRPADNANDHFPNAVQQKNVALLMYWPEPGNILLKSADVGLHFRDADFDEVRNDSLWLLGRQGSGYVAVRRSCIGEIDNVRACPTVNAQSWVIVVGDSAMYGNFDNFQDVVVQAAFSDSYYYDSVANQNVYYASVTVDTIELEYTWARDSVVTGIVEVINMDAALNVYPNPTNHTATITYHNTTNTVASFKVVNLMGQTFLKGGLEQASKQIDTSHWPEGMYLVVVEQNGSRAVKRLVKME